MDRRSLLWMLPATALAAILVGAYVTSVPRAMKRARRSPCRLLGLRPVKTLKRLPGAALENLQGNRFPLSRLRGRLNLVNFWMTSCEPCLEELPSLLELATRYESRGLSLVLVSTDKRRKDVDRFLRAVPRLTRLPANVRLVLDPGGQRLARSWGTRKYPETYLFAPGGRLLGLVVGARNWRRRAVTACIEEHLPD